MVWQQSTTREFLKMKRSCAYLILCFFIAASIPACAPYHAGKRPLHYKAQGKASWYGPGFAGRKTANGERFDPSKLTAAHRTLPFNTTVKVTNVENGKSVIVRINDRGPFIRGRIIDLSKVAAEKIGLLRQGVTNVEIVTLNSPDKKAALPPPKNIPENKLLKNPNDQAQTNKITENSDAKKSARVQDDVHF